MDAVDEPTSRRVCQLIAGIIVADDDLDPTEDAFIERIMAKFDLPAGARRGMFPIVDRDEAAGQIRKLPEEVRAYTLEMLIQAATVDGKVVDRERAFLEAVSDAMGVTRAELGARIDKRLASLDD